MSCMDKRAFKVWQWVLNQTTRAHG